MPMMWSSVDLPAPDGPMMDTNSPSLMSIATRRNTHVRLAPSAYDFSTFRIDTSDSAGPGSVSIGRSAGAGAGAGGAEREKKAMPRFYPASTGRRRALLAGRRTESPSAGAIYRDPSAASRIGRDAARHIPYCLTAARGMRMTNRLMLTMALLGTAASLAVAGLLWMIVTHPVAIATALSHAR